MAALQADRGWRSDGGTSRDLWEAWIVGLALSRFVAEQRCPVSLPKRKGESWQEAAKARREPIMFGSDSAYRGHCETPLSDSGGYRETDDVARVAAEQFEPMEDRLDDARSAAEVRAILDQRTEAARAVLLGEEKSADVAERLGLTRNAVYEQTARAMRALRSALG